MRSMTIATTVAPAQRVVISRDGPHAYFTDLPSAVADQLTAPEWRPAPHVAGVRAERCQRPLLRQVRSPEHGDNVHVCAAGLAPVVARHLVRAGIRVELRAVWTAPLPMPNLAPARRAFADAGLLAAIKRHSHLLVRHGPGVHMEAVAAMVALAWPKLRVAVAVARVDEARDLAAALRVAGVTTALATHKHIAGDEANVVVATLGQIGRLEVGLHDLDILILPDAVEALGNRSRDVLVPSYWPGSVRVPRIVGFVPAGRRLAPADRIGLMEICGPFSHDLPCLGVAMRAVTVVMMTIRGGPVSALRLSAQRSPIHIPPADPGGRRSVSALRLADFLKTGVWNHPVRNRRLARLARMLVQGDGAGLIADFPAVAAIDDMPLPATVMVMVEGPEQAVVVSKHLPDWPVLGRPDSENDLASHHYSFSPPRGQIVTFDRLRELPFLDADVIIRADGGTGALPLSSSALESHSGWVRRPLLIVDCDDRHHPELRRRSRFRRMAYRELGWLQSGQDQVDLALDFLLDQVRT